MDFSGFHTSFKLKTFFKDPTSYEFTKAVHILKKVTFVLRTSPLRFHTSVRYAHPATEIDEIIWKNFQGVIQPILQVNFTGIAGIQGPLPLAYTDRLIQQSRSGDKAFESFLNIFNNRIVKLFYETPKFLPGYDPIPPLQSSLGQIITAFGGLDFPKPFGKYLLNYKTLFWQRIRSKENLQQILSSFLNATVHVSEFIAEAIPVSSKDITQIGRKFHTLGHDAFLGRTIWRQNKKIRLTLQHDNSFDAFNPYQQGEKLKHLKNLCRLYLPSFVHIEIFIQAQTGIPSILGRKHFLGYDTWLGQSKAPCPRLLYTKI